MAFSRIPSPAKLTRGISARLEIFSGWKEIARYLGKGVRTVQRYEREVGLPVHRPAGKPRGSVITTKAELDRWVGGGAKRTESMPKSWPGNRTNQLRADFLLIDSQVALTFSGIALGASDQEKRKRTIRTARTAYDAIERLRKGIDLSYAEKTKLDANIDRLKNELESLGQSF
jgi:hypothetical protein